MSARVILLVEDNPQDEFLIRRSLTAMHPENRVDVVRDGQQALDYLFREGEILAPDGHCRAFDADAQGTVFGSGAGAVVLRRLEDALADGDPDPQSQPFRRRSDGGMQP